MKRLALLSMLAFALAPCFGQQARTAAGCNDTSFSRLIGIQNMQLRVYSSTKISNDGMLVSGVINDTTAANPFPQNYGLLLKLDRLGHVLWVKRLEENTPGYNLMSQARAFELNNGDIIFTAQWTTDANGLLWNTIVARLNSSGSLLWQNCLRSDLTVLQIPKGHLQFQAESAADGLNGDVILAGTHFGNLEGSRFATAVRLNTLGRLVWDANYGNIGGGNAEHRKGVHGIQAWMQNGQVGFAALNNGIGSMTFPTISLLALDYSNGQLASSKFYITNYVDFVDNNKKKFAPGYGRFTWRSNGNFLFYGRINAEIYNVPLKEHFGVVEFDPNFNIRDAYTIASAVSSNWELSEVRFNPSGRGTIALYPQTGTELYIGSFEDRVFRKQRVIYYPNGQPDFTGLLPQDDSSYVLVRGSSDNLSSQKSLVEFSKMHNIDSSSVCLGADTSLFSFLPVQYVETLNFLDQNRPNTLLETPLTLSISDAGPTHTGDRCRQITICDTLKIHGASAICGNQPYADFTSYKNRECSQPVFWEIDNMAIDSLRLLSDSSVRIWFKNKNWKGTLYAKIFGTDCSITPVDSMELTVLRSQPTPDLGADKELCPQQNIVLHAGHLHSSYLWQNGSTDSTLQVTSAGKYWVSTQDACGNNFSDTVEIIEFNPTVDLGPDRSKCNNDTLHLVAPEGFLSYTWSNNYNINSTTERTAIVFPIMDTAYYVSVEKQPGCFAYDTIRIRVNASPLISLPVDTFFCIGDTIILDAGPGFEQYAWSNGDTRRQASIYRAGKYSIAATYTNGCISRDTVDVRQKECREGFHAPNAFTPNDDAYNNTFRPIIGGEVVSYLLKIYNRHGQLVYSSNDQYRGWDGTFAEKKQLSGIFAWTCRYKLEGQAERMEKGTIMLVR